jgi:hypothetical protein
MEKGRINDDKLRLPKISEISIWLDTYDDLFSDFDPRPYEDRAVSVDFVDQAKMFSREKNAGMFELVMLIPHNLHDVEMEREIIDRLKKYFKANYLRVYTEIKSIRIKGLMLVFSAIVILSAATWVSLIQDKNMLWSFMLVILEPAGWFTIWNGLDLLFFAPGKRAGDLDFYQKMSDCQMIFMPY